MNLYVGNLSFNLSETDITRAFEAFGPVKSVRLVTDRETGRARGFGFVEMETQSAGLAAIDGLNDKELDGRRLVVNEARAKTGRY